MNIQNYFIVFLVALCIANVSFASCCQAEVIPIHIEYAITPTQKKWGLMGRKHMADAQGMLFYFEAATRPTFWSFGCYIDIAVLFIDDRGTISEIYFLKAFPEIMDARRPINRLEDLDAYSSNDPILQFFLQQRIRPKNAYHYVLEMSLHSFRKFSIKTGDTFNFSNHTIDTKPIKLM